MSATLHKLPNIKDGPQIEVDLSKVSDEGLELIAKYGKPKTYALIRKVGGIYHIRLGRYRISICRVKG